MNYYTKLSAKAMSKPSYSLQTQRNRIASSPRHARVPNRAFYSSNPDKKGPGSQKHQAASATYRYRQATGMGTFQGDRGRGHRVLRHANTRMIPLGILPG